MKRPKYVLPLCILFIALFTAGIIIKTANTQRREGSLEQIITNTPSKTGEKPAYVPKEGPEAENKEDIGAVDANSTPIRLAETAVTADNNREFTRDDALKIFMESIEDMVKSKEAEDTINTLLDTDWEYFIEEFNRFMEIAEKSKRLDLLDVIGALADEIDLSLFQNLSLAIMGIDRDVGLPPEALGIFMFSAQALKTSASADEADAISSLTREILEKFRDTLQFDYFLEQSIYYTELSNTLGEEYHRREVVDPEFAKGLNDSVLGRMTTEFLYDNVETYLRSDLGLTAVQISKFRSHIDTLVHNLQNSDNHIEEMSELLAFAKKIYPQLPTDKARKLKKMRLEGFKLVTYNAGVVY